MPRISLILLIAVLALASSACGLFWSSSIEAGSSYWSIYRHSSNVSFNMSSSVDGKISPVESRGRILQPYQAYYAELEANDLRLRERTNALEGSYKSSDDITMESLVYQDQIDIFLDKPVGTEVYTIEYKNEKWPVFIKSARSLAYTGRRINDMDFQANSGDYIGSRFLYNRDLNKDKLSVMWLQKLNATVKATDDSILSAELEATKYLGDQITARSTGIADFSYGFRDSGYDAKHNIYPYRIMGEERYYGDYDLSRKVEMRSVFDRYNDTEDEDDEDSWLPCCNSDWNDILLDENGFSAREKEIFDCRCFRGTTKAG